MCINRFASLFAARVESRYFTNAYFHARGELAAESAEAVMQVIAELPVEGVA